MAVELKEAVNSRAGNRCEYCLMHQSLQGATFHIEHVFPRSAGGTSDFDNLAFACPSCNLHKSDKVSVALVGFDQPIAFFNPRKEQWRDHFAWDDYNVIGKTDVGKATIIALDLNHERRIKIRKAEQLFGLFPYEVT